MKETCDRRSEAPMSRKVLNSIQGGFIALGLTTSGYGAYEVGHTISGATGREMAQKNSNVTPEEISSKAGGDALGGTLYTFLGLGTIGAGLGFRRILPFRPI